MDAKQIIGIDLSSEEYGDWTGITSICSKCKSIVESKTVTPEDNAPQASIFIRCPICGVKFKNHMICK